MPIVPPPASEPTVNTHESTVSPSPPASAAYTREEKINYLLEIAIGTEYGGGVPRILKWAEPLRLRVKGAPTARDATVLREVMDELEKLTRLDISFAGADETYNVDIYFVPVAEFRKYLAAYTPGNNGFFWFYWDDSFRLKYATILIDTGLNATERPRFIREELTQIMGLANDSYSYSESIFYQNKTSVKDKSIFFKYTSLDKDIIQLLYSNDIRAGMSRADIRRLSGH